jgi:hypothetical protein
MEVKHRCNQVLELGFPLGGLAKLFAQDWEGDVTVVMPATLAQVCNVSYSLSCHANVLFTLLKQMSVIDTVISKLTHDFFPTIISIPR